MDGIELLLKRNKEERDALIGVLVRGNAKDYAEYKSICGVVRGLDLADQHITDLAERMQKQNDDDGA